MIISRTPFRISFFGGGTDYPVWFQEHDGAVLAATINKYGYLTCRRLPPFFDHQYRISYSKIEHAKTITDIIHPSVRETLKFMDLDTGLEIHHDADLPARSGLGSSSSFTVGLLHALYGLKGVMPGKKRLAEEAIHIEQNLIKENVGCQDQVMAAYGGFNIIHFNRSEYVRLQPVTLKPSRSAELQRHLMLFFTGLVRTASEIAREQIHNTPQKKTELTAMYQMVEEAAAILTGEGDIKDFGRLMHESWMYKRTLSNKISTERIDEIYAAGREAGAVGGKLLGAGGGGFMLLFVPPELQAAVLKRLRNLLLVPFSFEGSGSTIIFFQPEQGHEV